VDDRIKREPYSLPDAMSIITKSALALEYIHLHEVLHGDLKPSNILLTPDGEPILTDFLIPGLESTADYLEASTDWLLDVNLPIGTPLFTAPELWEGKPNTIRTDQYAFAATVYYMLTGKFSVGDLHTLAEIKASHMYSSVVNHPRLEGFTYAVLSKSLAIDPNERYTRVLELARDLERIAEGRVPTIVEAPKSKVKETQEVIIKPQISGIDRSITPRMTPTLAPPLRVFMSYSRKNAAQQAQLVEHLRARRHEVWYDAELMERGGQSWWDAICEQIRDTDLFLFALSQESLASAPCQREFEYAHALKKRILPVKITSTNFDMLPPALMELQVVDFFGTNGSNILDASLANLPTERPLPDPLPPPPPAPIPSINVLADRIRSRANIPPDDQVLILFELEELLESEEVKPDSVLDVLGIFKDRDDVTARVAAKIDVLITSRRRRRFRLF
jgi:hypothetical protein